MIDTIRFFKVYDSIKPSFWQDVGFVPLRINPRMLVLNRENKPNLTAWYGNATWYLGAQISIPRILYGHNALLPSCDTDALHAVEIACSYTEDLTGLPFEPKSLRIGRIDYTRDFHLRKGANLDSIIQAIFAKTLPRMTRRSIANTIYFEQGRPLARRITIYPKLAEVLSRPNPKSDVIEAANRKLRLEVRLERYGIQKLARKTGGKSPFHLVNYDLSQSVIFEFMKLLDFERTIDTPSIDFYERLTSATSCSRERGVFWFIETVIRHGPEFYKNPKFQCKERTFYNYQKRCKTLGFWDDMVDSSFAGAPIE
jgi:hypothetical protein